MRSNITSNFCSGSSFQKTIKRSRNVSALLKLFNSSSSVFAKCVIVLIIPHLSQEDVTRLSDRKDNKQSLVEYWGIQVDIDYIGLLENANAESFSIMVEDFTYHSYCLIPCVSFSVWLSQYQSFEESFKLNIKNKESILMICLVWYFWTFGKLWKVTFNSFCTSQALISLVFIIHKQWAAELQKATELWARLIGNELITLNGHYCISLGPLLLKDHYDIKHVVKGIRKMKWLEKVTLDRRWYFGNLKWN